MIMKMVCELIRWMMFFKTMEDKNNFKIQLREDKVVEC